MLHSVARKLLEEAYEQTHDAQTVAKYFQVSTSTVYRLSGQMKKTGGIDLQTSQRGRKPALTEEDLKNIDQRITARLRRLVFCYWYSLLISWIAIMTPEAEGILEEMEQPAPKSRQYLGSKESRMRSEIMRLKR